MTYKTKKLYKRKRNKIISFRATEEEAKLLDRKVEISGLTKQEYIISSLTVLLCPLKLIIDLKISFP